MDGDNETIITVETAENKNENKAVTDNEQINQNEAETEAVAKSADAYYLDRGEFSSEIFKLEVKNLPKNFGFGQLRKFLTNLNLKYVKLKSPGSCTHAFVTFISEEAREEARKVLNETKFKGRQLEATVSNFISKKNKLRNKIE